MPNFAAEKSSFTKPQTRLSKRPSKKGKNSSKKSNGSLPTIIVARGKAIKKKSTKKVSVDSSGSDGTGSDAEDTARTPSRDRGYVDRGYVDRGYIDRGFRGGGSDTSDESVSEKGPNSETKGSADESKIKSQKQTKNSKKNKEGKKKGSGTKDGKKSAGSKNPSTSKKKKNSKKGKKKKIDGLDRGMQFGEQDDFSFENEQPENRLNTITMVDPTSGQKIEPENTNSKFNSSKPYESLIRRKLGSKNPCFCCCGCRRGFCNLRINCKFIAILEIIVAIISIPVLMNILSILEVLDKKVYENAFGIEGLVEFIAIPQGRFQTNVTLPASQANAIKAVGYFKTTFAAYNILVMGAGTVSLVAGAVLYICIVTRSAVGCWANTVLIVIYVILLSLSIFVFCTMLSKLTDGYRVLVGDAKLASTKPYTPKMFKDLKKFATKKNEMCIFAALFGGAVCVIYLYFSLCSYILGIQVSRGTDKDRAGAHRGNKAFAVAHPWLSQDVL